MEIKLSTGKRLIHYSVSMFFIVLSIVAVFLMDYRDILEDIIITSILLLLAVVTFIIKRQQLKFKVYEIPCTMEELEEAIMKTSRRNEWEVKRLNDHHYMCYQHVIFWINLVTTIFKEGDKIYINCMQDPDTLSEGLTFGIRRENIKSFILNLTTTKELAVKEENRSREKWGVVDYLLRVIAYPVCFIMLYISFYSVNNGESVFFGILIGILAISILVYDYKVIKDRKESKR